MAKVRLGNEVLVNKMSKLVQGQKIGLITNYTGINSEFISTVDILHKHLEFELVALFGPEHGIRGEAQAGEKVTSYLDPETGLPVYSLYGETKKPTTEMLQGIDTLIYDIQDVGVRYYTYISTLSYTMEKAAELGLKYIVLDRPNLIRGDIVAGNILDPAFASFIGLHPIPNRYGMTIGELALLMNEEFGIGADLTVVPMEGWRRFFWFNETGLPWLAPSMGIPTLDTAILYTATAYIEGTNLSEGRGTTQPFHIFGAPWVNGKELAQHLNSMSFAGVYFRPTYFKPMTSKHQGQLCQGVQVHLLDRNQIRGPEMGLRLLLVLKELYPEDFQWFTFTKEGVTRYFIDLLWGTERVRRRVDSCQSVDVFFEEWEQQLVAFEATRKQYLLYE